MINVCKVKDYLITCLLAVLSFQPVLASPDGIQSFALTDGTNVYSAFSISNGYIDIQVPPDANLSALKAVFVCSEGSSVTVDNVEQVSGVSAHDFTDFVNPVKYLFASETGEVSSYTVRMFNLPIIFVETEDNRVIDSKEDWLPCTFTIRMTDGSIESFGPTSIKGRGNTSWSQQDKKPYTIKFDKKQKVLGMPKHKRWQLLTTYGNSMSFFRDDLMFEVARRTSSLGWAPHGQFADMFVNGEHKGLYWLCEKIGIDKNRININELSEEDTDPEIITGGYLLEFAGLEDPQFNSEYFNLNYCIKEPDAPVADIQFSYIQDYINTLEACLMDDERLANHEYEEFLDVETWIDYWFMHEMAERTDINLPGRYEGLSCFCFKDRGGKLKAGPVWDMHFGAKDGPGYHAKDKLYYKRLFEDDKFIARVKEKWYGTESEKGFPELIGDIDARVDSIAALIQRSGDRDLSMWDKNETILQQASDAKRRYNSNIRWMNLCVKDLPKVTGKDSNVSIVDYDQRKVQGIYTISGMRTNSLKPGINIIRMSDGSVVKVFKKH